MTMDILVTDKRKRVYPLSKVLSELDENNS